MWVGVDRCVCVDRRGCLSVGVLEHVRVWTGCVRAFVINHPPKTVDYFFYWRLPTFFFFFNWADSSQGWKKSMTFCQLLVQSCQLCQRCKAVPAVPAMPAVPAIPARGPPLKNILPFSLFVPCCLINQAVIDQIVTKLQQLLHPMCASKHCMLIWIILSTVKVSRVHYFGKRDKEISVTIKQ